jgi:hypothetical protein
MLQIFKNWPNTTVSAIRAAALSVVFMLGIAISPASNRMAVPIAPSQPNMSMNSQTVGAKPQSGLPKERNIDYTVIFPQNLP